MQLKLAIKQSSYRAAYLIPEGRYYKYVVVQHGPFTFPDNFIDAHYGTEIHRYNGDGVLDYAIVNFKPINFEVLRLQLGPYIDSKKWLPYEDAPFNESRVKGLKRYSEAEQRLREMYPELFYDE